MSPARVVSALDPGEDGQTRFGLGPESLAVEQFALQVGKEVSRPCAALACDMMCRAWTAH